MKKWLSLVILFYVSIVTFSQNDIAFFSFKEGDKLHDIKTLNANVSSLSFLKNNEYKDSYLKGYTLVGSIIRPTLNYTLTNNLSVDAGVQLLANSGRDMMTYQSLIWAVKYNATPSLNVTFGSLDYSNRHQLIDPIYDCEKFISEKPESGLSIAFAKPFFKAETWVNWEQYLLQNDPFQEVFTFGLSTSTHLLKSDFVELSIPVQLLARHHGGEIDSSPDPMETLVNGALGVNLKVKINNRFFNEFHCSGYGLIFNDIASTGIQKFSKGNALFFDAGINCSFGMISASYWNGNRFIAPKGNLVYQSTILNDGALATEVDRSLLIGRYFLDRKITEGANFGFELNGFYDLQSTILSYNYGFYLNLSLDFLLKDFSK